MDKIDLRYQRGKIYTVRCYDDDLLIYVGSTIDKLSARMAKHRCAKNCSLSQYVIENFNGDWKKWYIELYEEYPCNNKELLEKREGEITRLIGSLNQNIAGRTKKEYYEDNKEKLLEQKKQYRNDNKEKIKKKHKKYYENNKEHKAEYDKKYRNDNKEKILEKRKQYRNDNKQITAERNKKYREANKQIIAEKAKEKVICDHCGCEVNKSSLNKHKKTNKCKNYNITKE
jgi:FtsZ-interacting cell division protein YlmF